MMYNKFISGVLSAHISAQGTSSMRENYTESGVNEYPDDSRDVNESGILAEIYRREHTQTRWNRINVLAAAATAAVVVAVGSGIAWSQRGGEHVGAKTTPTATAPFHPGEQSTAGASEAAPTSSTGEVVSGSELTLDTFPFETADGTFTGVEHFKQGQQLLVSDYRLDGVDSTKKDISDLIIDFTKLRVAHMNSGVAQSKSGKFNSFSVEYKDQVFNGDMSTVTGPEAVFKAYDIAFEEAFIDDTKMAGRLEGNHRNVRSWQRTDPSYGIVDIKISSARSGREPDNTLYPGKTSDSGRGGVLFLNVQTVSIDSQGVETTTIETIDFRRVLDNGREVWKVFRFESIDPSTTQE